MVLYRTVIWKNPSEVKIPDESQRDTFNTEQTNNLNDFETNYKANVIIIQHANDFDVEIPYQDFKAKIDGTTITWNDVLMFETKNAYYLYVNA